MSRAKMGTSGAPSVSQLLHRRRKTPSTKHHRFQSFSSRIAATKIKPFRINEAERRLHADIGDADSHFKVCLDKWKDQNMSTNFTDFVAQADPLCQSLTQVIHHRADIVDLLVQYINNRDVHSLEPLLELLVCLADDLWLRFEEYFERIIRAIADVAATHMDVEAVEWSFDAIAGLFKRFARVLEQDLKPLFTLMAPLLGKVKQKAHVSRFAAEALSFLVRRASSIDDSSTSRFADFVRYTFNDLFDAAPQQRPQYKMALMTMFADATKSSQLRLRESAPEVVSGLLALLFDLGSDAANENLALASATVEGILTSIIHHTDSENFEPVAKQVLKSCTLSNDQDNCPNNVATAARLLYVMTGVRKGTRVSGSGWKKSFTALTSLLETQDDAFSNDENCAELLLDTCAVVLQYAPLELVNPRIHLLLEKIVCGSFQHLFLRFCSIMSDLGHERFDSLVGNTMRQFIVHHWNSSRDAVLVLLPKFGPSIQRLSLPDIASKSLVEMCDRIVSRPEENYAADALIELLSQASSASSMNARADLEKRLLCALDQALECRDLARKHNMQDLLLGRALEYLVRNTVEANRHLLPIPRVLATSPSYGSSIGYLEALRAVLHDKELSRNVIGDNLDKLIQSVTQNLASPYHNLRQTSLGLLESLHIARDEIETADWLQHAEAIESAHVDAREIRAMSLKVRRLGQFVTKSSSASRCRAIAAYCFGLLHLPLAPLWEDAIAIIGQSCSLQDGEDYVVEVILEWLQRDSSSNVGSTDDRYLDTPTPPQRSSEFQCTNLMALDETIKACTEGLRAATAELRRRFERHNVPKDLGSPNDRLKSLRILKCLPRLAEKKSRLLVPIFFDWLSEYKEYTGENPIDSDDDTVLSPAPFAESSVSREDKKSLLQVFANFENPKTLHRSNEVYASLMNVLCSGDADLQKPALQALFAWRSPAIRPYHDNLMSLLEDTRFREELTVFLHVDDEDSTIQSEHRSGLMPILLRLLYGRAIARTGTKDRGGLVVRRKAILVSLARLGEDAVKDFVAIAMNPVTVSRVVLQTSPPSLDEHQLSRPLVSWRKHVGMIRMIQDIVGSISNFIEPVMDRLVDGIIFCLMLANRHIQRAISNPNAPTLHEMSEVKAVRQEGIKALSILFDAIPSHDWSLYKPILLDEVLAPRLHDLIGENAQGISALLRLFAAWASSSNTIDLLLTRDQSILQRLTESLSMDVVKSDVKQFILTDIVASALQLADPELMLDDHSDRIVVLRTTLANGLAQKILQQIEGLLSHDPSRELLESSISVVDQLQLFVNKDNALKPFILVIVSLLDLNRKHLNHAVRSRLLGTLETYLPLADLETGDDVFVVTYDALSSLFNYFLDVPNRQLLARVFNKLVDGRGSLQVVGTYCEHLNARSSSRLGEADVAAQGEVFAAVADIGSTKLNAREWQPLVHNFLFMLKDDTDLSAERAGASLCLRSFASSLKVQPQPVSSISQSGLPFWDLDLNSVVEHIVLPAVRRGIRESSETVRGEFLRLLEDLVRSEAPYCADMKVLLGGPDYPSFFVAVLAAQHSQRLNAWRKLAMEGKHLNSKTIATVVVPLIETTIAQVTEKNQNLVNEAVMTFDKVAECLNWSQYRLLLQRMMKEKKRFESKLMIRVLSAVVNAFHRARLQKMESSQEMSRLAQSLPDGDGLTSVFDKTTLPRLMEFMHFKDEAKVDYRVPVALVTVKIIMAYPEEQVTFRLPAVLMDICNILKSKAQEARDATRRTLAEISAVIGPSYFGFIVKQLKACLSRGAHLHILTFTLQYLLRVTVPFLQPGDIDYCLPDLLSIAYSDIFGALAEEKDNPDYKSRTKEVRSKKKGYDSLQLVASIASPAKLMAFLTPIIDQIRARRSGDSILGSVKAIVHGIRLNPAYRDDKTVLKSLWTLANQPQNRTHSPIMRLILEAMRILIGKKPELANLPESTGLVDWLVEIISATPLDVAAMAYDTLTLYMNVRDPDSPDVPADKIFASVEKLFKNGMPVDVDCTQSAVITLTTLLRKSSNQLVSVATYRQTLHKVMLPLLQQTQNNFQHDVANNVFGLLEQVAVRNHWGGELEKMREYAVSVAQDIAYEYSGGPISSAYRTLLEGCRGEDDALIEREFALLLEKLRKGTQQQQAAAWSMVRWWVEKMGRANLLMDKRVALLALDKGTEAGDVAVAARAAVPVLRAKASRDRVKDVTLTLELLAAAGGRDGLLGERSLAEWTVGMEEEEEEEEE